MYNSLIKDVLKCIYIKFKCNNNFHSGSVYRAKMKSRTWYKSSTNSLKDWQYWHVYHIGRKMRLAATVNNTMLMSSLLQTGVSPNSPDSDGRTPLHHAACR